MLSHLSRFQLLATLWTGSPAVHGIPLSMGVSRQEYWSGLPFPPPGDLPKLELRPVSLMSPALAGAAKSLQSCPTLCNPIDCSPPGSSVSGILQARTLEWVAISFSNACMHAKSLRSCPTLCDPMDGSPPGSLVHRILQARTLEWVAFLLHPALAGGFFATSTTWDPGFPQG